jgi:hypothetical protein
VSREAHNLAAPFSCVDFAKGKSGMIVAIVVRNNMKVVRLPGTTPALQLEVQNDEVAVWTERMRLKDNVLPSVEALADGAMLAIGLTMILNTKGIRKERIAPPAKPNKARAKAGRPLLPWVTRVYTNVYNQAVAPGQGTHASPRPHRRRAHMRHYPARGDREAYIKPIDAMLINWDGKPLERGQYDVVKPGEEPR